ncbi:NAD-dependent epimerase/dehydratase family protein [Lentzea nigeriaca]|uniref:NAD-dependent epimerase/dehydratase family protein n=1 Tax=Lentzea nigeriaca TaxID=1128665 RepID=UPI001957A6E8|nr:NAD(P)-dependent oxidoreductase [Lentzea nigeriaca]MBM7857169.1 nucleoside-diphosphate-sugar epimerase [Lentzea nigeriaca]
MRVLVIGAGGFLGAHVRRAALDAGFDVVTAGRSPLASSPRHLRIDLGTVTAAALAELIARLEPNAVVNCAGAIEGDERTLAMTNVDGVTTLVRALALAGGRIRLVHLGSAAEYGPGLPGIPVTESTPPQPIGDYGHTKLLGTRMIERARMDGLDGVVLRVFNPVGAGAGRSGLPGRAAAALRVAVANREDLRLGPLDAVRDFVDARDVADAALAAVTAEGLPPVLNIGSGRGLSCRDLVKELLAISGASCAVREDDGGSARSAGVSWQQADITLATTVLEWRPRRNLANAVADLWWSS